MRRAEIHFHALPGVDDGPRTLAESIELLRLAEADGTDLVVATPHVREVVVEELPERVAELARELRRSGVEVELRCGGELGYDDDEALSDDALEILAQGERSPWLLLESPFSTRAAGDFHAAAERLRERGYGVVLAHPERSPMFAGADGERALGRELERGSVVQLTAGALRGRNGADAQRRAERWILDGRAGAISSDAHGFHHPPCLAAARAAVEALAGAEVASRLVDEAPRRLLEGFDRG